MRYTLIIGFLLFKSFINADTLIDEQELNQFFTEKELTRAKEYEEIKSEYSFLNVQIIQVLSENKALVTGFKYTKNYMKYYIVYGDFKGKADQDEISKWVKKGKPESYVNTIGTKKTVHTYYEMFGKDKIIFKEGLAIYLKVQGKVKELKNERAAEAYKNDEELIKKLYAKSLEFLDVLKNLKIDPQNLSKGQKFFVKETEEASLQLKANISTKLSFKGYSEKSVNEKINQIDKALSAIVYKSCVNKADYFIDLYEECKSGRKPAFNVSSDSIKIQTLKNYLSDAQQSYFQFLKLFPSSIESVAVKKSLEKIENEIKQIITFEQNYEEEVKLTHKSWIQKVKIYSKFLKSTNFMRSIDLHDKINKSFPNSKGQIHQDILLFHYSLSIYFRLPENSRNPKNVPKECNLNSTIKILGILKKIYPLDYAKAENEVSTK